MSMLNRTTRLHNFADAGVQIQRRRCSISAAEALNFNAVCNECERVEVERKFSLAKRKCGMGMIVTRLKETTCLRPAPQPEKD